MKLKCLIVDDEPPAVKIIQNYLSKLDNACVSGTAANAIEAFNFLGKNEVDVLFLDVNMPEVSGINLLKILKDPPAVILTTAYSNYALESYEYNVTDYLLKPIRFERFVQAFEKAKAAVFNRQPGEAVPATGYLDIKVNGSVRKVFFNDIFYLQSLGNYIRIHTSEGSFITLLSTKDAEASLPKIAFARVHKSYIVNTTKVTSHNNEFIFIGGASLPIGKTYKKYFLERRLHLLNVK